jgi:hypothetical protein
MSIELTRPSPEPFHWLMLVTVVNGSTVTGYEAAASHAPSRLKTILAPSHAVRNGRPAAAGVEHGRGAVRQRRPAARVAEDHGLVRRR